MRTQRLIGNDPLCEVKRRDVKKRRPTGPNEVDNSWALQYNAPPSVLLISEMASTEYYFFISCSNFLRLTSDFHILSCTWK